MPISTLSRPRLFGNVTTGLQLFIQSGARGIFPTTSISVGSRSINGFRGVWATDSCCSHPHTTEKPLPRKLEFHWFLADRWVFEENGPRIRVSYIELLMIASTYLAVRVLVYNVLLIRWRTDRQTNFKHFLDPVKPFLSEKEKRMNRRI